MKSCFFIGHRDTGCEIYPMLVDEVERHITEYGVTDFVVGCYGAFDRMATQAVKTAKERYPDVRLTILLPYYPSGRIVQMPDGIDGTFYPPGMESVPKRLAIVRANRYMVDHSTHLIACVKHPSNGSREVLEWALKRQKRGLMHVTNLMGWYPL